MAEYLPPIENVPIFDSGLFNSSNQSYLTFTQAQANFLSYPIAQGTETLQAVNVNGSANFNNDVSFNYLNTPPHCSIPPTQANDLCNKAYVDSQAPLTAYQLFCNYTSTFTTPTPITYKLLSSVQDINPTTLPFTITTIGNQYITGFFNLLSTLQLGTTIPAGNWTFNCYANVNTISDQSHVGLYFSIIGVSSGGIETVIGTSALSSLLTVVSPAIGLYSMIITLPLIDISSYVDLGVKIYINSNVGATIAGNIFFQNTNSYTSLLTTYAVLVAPNILTTNNPWIGTNTFNNSVIVNTAYPSLNPYMSITNTPQSIQLYPNSVVGSYNPLISANDNAIYGLSSSGIGTAVLDLTTYSATTSGVKINNNSVLIGAGGTTSTPTNSTTWSTLGVNTVSPICPFQSGYTVPLASDSSTNIATSAWTQSAILGLLSAINTWTGTNTFNNAISSNGVSVGQGVVSTNINIGNNNLNLTTSGTGYNIALGSNIMNSLTSGNYNIITGAYAGQTITTGTANNAYGSSALLVLSTGSFNSAFGNRAGSNNLSGSYNVYVGAQAGQGNTSGNYNTYVGQGTGSISTGTGSNNTLLGASTSITGGVSNSTAIGISATTGVANTIQLGRTLDNVNCPNTLSVTGIITATGGITGNASTATTATNSINAVTTTSNVASNFIVPILNTTTSAAGNYPYQMALTLANNLFFNPGSGFLTCNGANINSLTISSTSGRIMGDFSASIPSYRTLFQSSVTNGFTSVGIVPNGTSSSSGITCYNNYNTINCGSLTVGTSASNHFISSSIVGSGTQLPIIISNGSLTALTIDTAANLSVAGNITFTGIAPTIATNTTEILTLSTPITTGGIINLNCQSVTTPQISISAARIDFSQNTNYNGFNMTGANIIQSLGSGALGLTLKNVVGNTGAVTIQNDNLTATANVVIQTAATSVGTIILQPKTTPAVTVNADGTTRFAQQTLYTYGSTITATITLATPMKNFYLITSSAVSTVSFPVASATYAGCYITFRRQTNLSVITFNQTGGASFIVPYNSVTPAASASLIATQFNTSFTCDGTYWFQLATQ